MDQGYRYRSAEAGRFRSELSRHDHSLHDTSRNRDVLSPGSSRLRVRSLMDSSLSAIGSRSRLQAPSMVPVSPISLDCTSTLEPFKRPMKSRKGPRSPKSQVYKPPPRQRDKSWRARTPPRTVSPSSRRAYSP